jgi:hypothetical protein
LQLIREIQVYEGRIVPSDFREGVNDREPAGNSSAPPRERSTQPDGPPATGESQNSTAGEDGVKDSDATDSPQQDRSLDASGTVEGSMGIAAALEAVRRRAARSKSAKLESNPRGTSRAARLRRRLQRTSANP